MKKVGIIVGIFCFLAMIIVVIATKSRPTEISPPSPNRSGGVPDFTLIDHLGTIHQLSRESDARAVVILSHDLNSSAAREASLKFAKVSAQYFKNGITFLLINPDPENPRAKIIESAKAIGLNLPILLDPSQVVTRSLGLSHIAEAAVIDTRDWNVVYRGAVESVSPILDRLIKGDSVAPTTAQPKGERIAFETHGDVSFSKNIAPIMLVKCMNCHHENGKFPPYFTSYEKVRAWSAMIRETLLTDRMPPFSADTFYGNYANDMSLTAKEKRLFVQWLDAGSPGDAGPDPLKTFTPWHPVLFRNRQPIFSAAMKHAADIPPQGEVEYKYFEIAGPVPEDLWIDGIHVRSTNARQLHHEALMVVPKPLQYYLDLTKNQRDEEAIAKNTKGDIINYTLLAMSADSAMENDKNYVRTQVWGLGKKQPYAFRKGVVLFIPKGYYLVLETHYMGTGKKETELTSIDFYGSKQKPEGKKPFKTLLVRTGDISIPPGVKRHIVRTPAYKFATDTEIFGFLGHLHMRGRSIRLEEIDKSGNSKIVMSIPNYYYGWQTGTGLMPDPPVRIAAGSKVVAVCEYDNSKQNPNNPDPTETVRFGQTHDKTEMCKVNLQMREAN